MPIKITTPDKKIRLQKIELQHLVVYCDACKTKAFTGNNNFEKFHQDREQLYTFILEKFAEKLVNKTINFYHESDKKNITIPINFAEEKTLLAMFQRVECSNYMLAVQQKILLILRPVNMLRN